MVIVLFTIVCVFSLHQCKALNLAFGRDTKQSCTWRGISKANFAVDGQTFGKEILSNQAGTQGRYCASSCQQNIYIPWWAVDLGAVYNISNIIIYGRTEDYLNYQLKEFDVEAIMMPSCSCDKWATLERGVSSHCHNQRLNVRFENLTCPQNTFGRFVRMKNRNANMFVLCELEVYGQLIPSTSALRKNAVKACVFLGKLYRGNSIGQLVVRSKLECVIHCKKYDPCCAAEFTESTKECTLKSKAEDIEDADDLFGDDPMKCTILVPKH